MELVSAIITTHNRRLLLTRAIESVLHQTYKNIELIVVDDHSDDGTGVVCQKYNVNYVYIPIEESKGGNYARNVGINAARGTYCAFLDDDDYWLPTKIEKQVALIETKDCEFVYCGRIIEYVNPDKIILDEELPDPNYWGDMHKKVLLSICTTTTNILASRNALIEVGLFDENLKFWQEYELMIRLAQRKPFYFVNEPLSVYRIDLKDKNRLTNKYFEWKKAVTYIYNKHSNLYDNLNFAERISMKMLYYNDARRRCKASGLYMRYFFLVLLCIPERLVYYIKKVY